MCEAIKTKKSSLIDIKAVDKQLSLDDSDEALPNPKTYQIVLGLIGGKGSGKSSVMVNLLRGFYKKKFENIYMICPSKDKKFEDLIDELVEEGKFYDLEDQSFTDSLQDIYEKLQNETDYDNLLILDDCMSDFSGCKILDRIVANSRHLRLTIFYTSQYYRKVPPVLRSNTDVYCIWNTNNLLERKKYQEELNVNHNRFEKYLGLIQGIPHSFITISFVGGMPRYYLKFDKILE